MCGVKGKYGRTAFAFLVLVVLPCALLIPCIIRDMEKCGSAQAATETVDTPAVVATPGDLPPAIDESDYPGIGDGHREVLVEQRALVRRAIKQADGLEDSLDEIR